ncbi:molybdopterin oxidoreductase family protein [Desulfobulbus sp.]|uniref:molybdopterin oxidoreductase family protein n=1 Tax=Desulfobulbus sp. TaxID=895 RepID=UPI00286F0992|nr:molybdopterin oxidoreductase family protein [Desulfobulbus sp.]
MSTIVRSACPYDCPDTCGLLIEREHGRAIRVSGDPEHPYSGARLCPKMFHYEKTVHSSRRLLKPLLRNGAKGTGAFREISWQEALCIVAGRWRAIESTHGAEAILPYSYAGTMGLVQRNAGHPLFHALGASRLERTICSSAKTAGLQSVLGNTPAPHPDEVCKSDLVVLWGINAAATSIHFLERVKKARRAGARVWLIDTYRHHTAPSADEVFLVKSGTDGALALGLMHVLAREGLVDLEFLLRKATGYPELARTVLPEHTPERTAELTGIPAPTVERMAREYARARAPFIRLGSGLSRYGNGAMTVRTIATLPALVGAYGKRHAGLLGGISTGSAFALGTILREDFMAAPTRIVNMNRLGQALNELDRPRIMALYVYHSNPAAVAPDQNAVLRGLARDDLFTVVHERFLTDTARYADLVLPATSSLEHADIYLSYGSYCLQRAWPAIPAVGESRSNWDVFTALAQELGLHDPFFRQSADELIDRLLAAPAPLREGIDIGRLAAGIGVELQRPPWPPERFGTPSGTIEILNPREAEPLPRYLPPHSAGDRLPLQLVSAPSPFALNASFYERDDLRAKQRGMRLHVHPAEAAARGLADGQSVLAVNSLGEVAFVLEVTDTVPPGVAVAEGVWWLEFAPGARSVNALTSQRLTDKANGSTFYDNKIDLRAI